MNNQISTSKTINWLTSLLLVVVIGVLVSGCGAEEPTVYKVGVLSGFGFFDSTVDGFKAGMAELGYKEGENIIYDVQRTNIEPEAEKEILKKFVEDNVDLIFVFPTEASAEAKAVTEGTDIPVVFSNALLEGTNLVDSIREPGGNITGVRFPGPDLSVKRLELLHQMVPDAKRIWVAYLENYPTTPSTLEVLRPAAESLGLTLVELPASSPADIQADLAERAAADDIGLDAILLIVEPLALSPDSFGAISQFGAEHNVPIGGALAFEGDGGAVFSLNPENIAVGELAAPLADKVLKGTQAGTIPVVSPENALVINYKVAENLGLTISEGLLSQATEIYR